MERSHLIEGCCPSTVKRVAAALLGDQRAPLASGMEGRDDVRDVPQVVVDSGALSSTGPPTVGGRP